MATKIVTTYTDDQVFCRLARPDYYNVLLTKMPHKNVLDMVLIYYVALKQDDGSYNMVTIDNENLKRMNKTTEELDDLAWANMRIKRPTSFNYIDWKKQSNKISRKIPLPDMYILKQENVEYGGSVWIADTHMLHQIGNLLRDDFIIMPLSIHVCGIIPYKSIKSSDDISDLRDKLQELNKKTPYKNAVLSDSIYRYIREKHKLFIDKS